MAAPVITPYVGGVPQRTDPVNFSAYTDTWVLYQSALPVEYNDLSLYLDALAVTIDGVADDAQVSANESAASAVDSAASAVESAASAQTAQSSANFDGRWVDASGTASVPSTYAHDGKTWQLLIDVPNIASTEPGTTNPDWQIIDAINMSNVDTTFLNNPLSHLFAPNSIVPIGLGNLSSTRASEATIIDRYGLLQTVSNDILRENQNGVLIEGEGENLVLYSEDFSQGAWTKTGDGSISASGSTKPSGTGLAWLFTSAIGGGSNYLNQSRLITDTSQDITYSIFVKKGVSDSVYLQAIGFGGTTTTSAGTFNLLTNTITNSTYPTASIALAADGWIKVSVTLPMNGTNSSINGRLSLIDAGDVNTSHAQLEESSFATSYIKTEAVAATREKDDVTRQVYGNIPMLSNPWSFVVDIRLNSVSSGSKRLFNTVSDTLYAQINAVGKLQIGSSLGSTTSLSALLQDVDYSIAFTYSALGDVRIYIDGVLDVTGSSKSFVDIVSGDLAIGSSNTGLFPLYGYLKNMRWYDRALTADEILLQAGI